MHQHYSGIRAKILQVTLWKIVGNVQNLWVQRKHNQHRNYIIEKNMAFTAFNYNKTPQYHGFESTFMLQAHVMIHNTVH